MKKENTPVNRYIIWIDQKKAIIGLIDNYDKFSHVILQSDIETRVRFKGETSNKIRLNTSKRTRETSEKRKLDQEVLSFCDKVLKNLKNPVAILITGPASVKIVLKKLIKGNQTYQNVIIKSKTTDKLTLAEIKAAGFLHYKVSSRKVKTS